ncbi:hypothetical protein BKA63DRAFT_486566 [Paraphoma chrysanthemicola]|nr:hypothetical protein BKA63DRAFT_486566 [Paraphoma chrysanthemicola]
MIERVILSAGAMLIFSVSFAPPRSGGRRIGAPGPLALARCSYSTGPVCATFAAVGSGLFTPATRVCESLCSQFHEPTSFEAVAGLMNQHDVKLNVGLASGASACDRCAPRRSRHHHSERHRLSEQKNGPEHTVFKFSTEDNAEKLGAARKETVLHREKHTSLAHENRELRDQLARLKRKLTVVTNERNIATKD